jgi:hypothetical protein
VYSSRRSRRYKYSSFGPEKWNYSLIETTGILESDKQIIQYKRKMIEDAHNQRWYYREDGVIYPQSNPNLVLDIRVNITAFLYNSLKLKCDFIIG